MGSAVNVDQTEGEAKPAEGSAEDAVAENEEEALPGIPENHYVLSYGPKTIRIL